MNDIKLPKTVIDRVESRWRSRHSRSEKRSPRVVDPQLEQLGALRNNIRRYRRLLETQLTDLERRYIEGRLTEEIERAKRLASNIAPLGTIATLKDDRSGESRL